MKKLSIRGFLIAFVGLTIISAIPMNVSAHSWFWWERPRKVIVTKDTKIEKIKVRYPRYRSYPVKTSTLKRGSVITTHHMASYAWSVQKKGYAHNSYYFWVMNSSSKPNWITPYSKNWIVWNKPMAKHQYLRATTKAYIYNRPGGKKIHNLKNYPKTVWYTSRHAKIKSGAVYYYITSGNKKYKGWVWHRAIKRNSGEITFTYKINKKQLFDSAFAVKNNRATIYKSIGINVLKKIKKSSQYLLIASKQADTYKKGTYYYVTDSKKRFSGWVAKKDISSDYSLIFKYADWKPYHTAPDESTDAISPAGKNPFGNTTTTYLKIGENLQAQYYASSNGYLIKRRNGQIGFYFAGAPTGMVPGYISGNHNYFVNEDSYKLTNSKTPMYDYASSEDNTFGNLLGYIPSGSKVYLTEGLRYNYSCVSYNDQLVYVPTSFIK